MVSLLITTYNRPQYLRQCLDSIKKADLSQVDSVLIVDDCSTDKETVNLINDFELNEVNLMKAFSKENRSIKGSLLYGCDILFAHTGAIINLDGDAIVRRDFVTVLLALKGRFYSHIISGFNCLTRNKNGSERHKVLMQGDDYSLRKSVGGINMLFDKSQYEKWVRPVLLKSLENNWNWDDHTCRASMADGKEIVVAVPSIIQHIGTEISSMGHSAGGEPPDEASDFVYDVPQDYGTRLMVKKGKYGEVSHAKLCLPKVSLIAVDDNVEGIIKAADISCRFIEFGTVKLLSSMESNDKRVIPIRHLGSKRSYSEFMMKEVVDYIDTPFFITIQADGYILRMESWDDNWLGWDFLGSPWEWYDDGYNTGNGAASLRSRRLHQILKDDPDIIPTNDHLIKECQEDHNIARIYRKYLEERYDIKFAPIEVARKFGIEAWNVKPPGNKYNNQFCFHGRHVDFSDANIWHIPY